MVLAIPKDGSPAWSLRLTAVLGAVILALWRNHALNNSYARFLAEAIAAHPGGQLQDLLAQASMAAPYTFGSRLVAYLVLGLHAVVGLPIGNGLACLQLALWVAQASLMFRLISAASRDHTAALLGTLFFGFDMPLFGVDAAYSLTGLDRSLGLTPLLWGITELVRGKRWTALMGIGAAVYLHGNPAIYVLPFLILEDGIAALRYPAARPGAVLRFILGICAALPLFLAGGKEPYAEAPFDYVRANLLLFAPSIGGYWQSSSLRIFELEGFCLVTLAAWKMRSMPSSGLWLRGVLTSFLMALAGTLSFRFYAPGEAFFGAIAKAQPWVGLYIAEVAGDVWLAAWLSNLIERRDWRWPLFMVLLLLSSPRDLILRGAALCIATAMAFDSDLLAVLGFAAAASVPWLYRWVPYVWQSVATAVGSVGGLFSGPAFHFSSTWFLAGAVLVGIWMRSFRIKHAVAPVLAVLLILAIGAKTMEGQLEFEDPDVVKTAFWVKDHTDPRETIFLSPLNLIECTEFERYSERAFFACDSYIYTGVMLFGQYAAPMAGRLHEMCFDFSKAQSPEDVDREIARAYLRFTPERLKVLCRKYGMKYLLTQAGRWHGTPLFQAGKYAVFAADPGELRP